MNQMNQVEDSLIINASVLRSVAWLVFIMNLLFGNFIKLKDTVYMLKGRQYPTCNLNIKYYVGLYKVVSIIVLTKNYNTIPCLQKFKRDFKSTAKLYFMTIT